MEHYAGIEVSLEASSACVVDGSVRIVREAKVASECDALVCSSGNWAAAGGAPRQGGDLGEAVKTDRNDACGIAQLLRMGWYRPVHWKSQVRNGMPIWLKIRRTPSSTTSPERS